MNRDEILKAFKAGNLSRADALKQLDEIEHPVIFREYRCPKCKVILGGLNARSEKDLPPCPKGHKTEFVPKAGSGEVTNLVRELGLKSSSRGPFATVPEGESEPDPLTYRQRIKNGEDP